MQTFKTFVLHEKKMAPKITANRGDVAEIVLGAAVTARFFHPPQIDTKITRAHVDDILKKVLRSKSVVIQRPDRKVGAVEIDDNIKFKVGVPAKAWSFISDPKNWKLVDDLFDGAIAYSNSDRRLRGQAFNMYANNKKDEIFVNSDGTGDQTGTKADIKLLINGKEAPQQISLKVDGGEQFGQVAGMTFDKQIELWSRLGVNVSSAEKAFNKKIEGMDLKMRFADRGSVEMRNLGAAIRAAVGESYKVATKQLQSRLPADKLSSFLKIAATKNDPSIELVKLVKGDFKRAKFGRNFEKNLKAMLPNLKIEFEMKTDPIVHIYDPKIAPKQSAKGRLIRVRGFYQQPSTKTKSGKTYGIYLRNIIEAGDLLFAVATDR